MSLPAPPPAPASAASPVVSVSHLVLRAKQLEIDALKHLAARAELVDVVGQLIHALQRERGATSVYLASGGQQFLEVRQNAVAQAQPLEAQARAVFATQIEPGHGASARMLSMMAWALHGLDMLDGLRAQIEQRTLSAHDSVAAFSRLIAGLVELIYHVADATAHPGISRLLVAFLHLVQSKEAAGQERAVGALLYASGHGDEAQQQRLIHLIDAQESSLRVFEEFAEPALRARWEQHLLTPGVARLERLRRTLCTARPGAALDTQLSDDWFEVSSAHITAQWDLQQQLVQALRQHCDAQVRAAEQALLDAEGLLQQLRDNPSPHAQAVERFFDAAAQPGSVPLPAAVTEGLAKRIDTAAQQTQASSLLDMLQAQSARLATMEAELETARRTLNERKVIERAKGVLMSRMGLTEEAAFRALQKTSMDQNRRLLDVAEATLSLPDFAFPRPGSGS